MVHIEVAEEQSGTLPAEMCMAQVERIIQSPEFDATEREGRFLRYVVEETLAGNATRIKAYSIAIAVFGRKESFDPQTDPIVRIEAGRLRRALERYYLTAGAADPLMITIPKGHYVPIFAHRDAIPPSEVPSPPRSGEPAVAPWKNLPRGWPAFRIAAVIGLVAVALLLVQLLQTRQPLAASPELPSVVVERFEDLSRTETSGDLATGLTQEVIARLARFRDITVIEPDANIGDGTPAAARYALHGSINLTPVGFRLRVRLIHRPDGAVLWSETYEGDLTVRPLDKAQADIADDVAMQLGRSYGVVLLADREYQRKLPPDNWAAYSCILSFHAFRAALDKAMLPSVLECLEETVKRFPDYSTAWAMLSLSRIDVIRSGFPYNPVTFKATLEAAKSEARRAITLDPQNVRALQAEMLVLFWDRQFAQGQVVGDRALELNPNDIELLADYGYRLAQSGAWQKGCAMIREAQRRDLVTARYYDPGLALCAYFAGNLTEATTHIQKADMTNHPLQLLVAAVVYGEAGDQVEADRVQRLLDEVSPAWFQDVRQEIELRIGRPEDVERILRSLAKAGIPTVAVQEAQKSLGN